ncbi:hypothetical protein K2173_005532 [Erythroxylum novogranatense]|uniref:DCD domain-containing protein n=1 Tax=Erythroxylum novogranatense TaxID=1862640 RepID=A0AAV8SL11_9ROSI|nr:hypothetical protein K2173_005532 [Erythroxylum novogranatense]
METGRMRNVKLLYGAYSATSEGKMYLDSGAFDVNFPAQVKFQIDADCLILSEFKFQSAIQDNYQKGKCSEELNDLQAAMTKAMPVPAVVPSKLSLAVMTKAMPSTAMEKQYHSQARVPIHDPYEPRETVLSYFFSIGTSMCSTKCSLSTIY